MSTDTGTGDVPFDRYMDALLMAVATRRAGIPGVESNMLVEHVVEISQPVVSAIRRSGLDAEATEALQQALVNLQTQVHYLLQCQLTVTSMALVRLADITGKSERDLLVEFGEDEE